MSRAEVGFGDSPEIQESGPSCRNRIRTETKTPSRSSPKPPPGPTCPTPVKEKKELSSSGGIVGNSGSSGSSTVPSKGLCVASSKGSQSAVQPPPHPPKSPATVLG